MTWLYISYAFQIKLKYEKLTQKGLENWPVFLHCAVVLIVVTTSTQMLRKIIFHNTWQKASSEPLLFLKQLFGHENGEILIRVPPCMQSQIKVCKCNWIGTHCPQKRLHVRFIYEKVFSNTYLNKSLIIVFFKLSLNLGATVHT